ncbi:NAD(P)H-hydrate dehydratase [Rhizobium sp. C4]|uniref:NAD(P)H-hydrate dehydratase n=1 Tax=Rhizobium sp. C4 TaxID=1349800 RepID=UPI001E30D209|nr:NAD(P)H-hydrate dehydratase [Rhizobium sp. C4]MCD2171482.1 NAD(P)H-hydrate dehydratase [Rhizobium sp. C4]
MTQEFERILIGPREMGEVDADAAASGIDSFRLMQNAGEAVAALALAQYPQTLRFAVLCGPGNNGGDGYVAAAALARSGANVAVYGLGVEGLKGDAALARAAFEGEVKPLSAYAPRAQDVIVDAIFGAGLSRDVPDDVARVIAESARLRLPVIAADVPSGLDGETGEIRGASFAAQHTVTFMARKPGHLLLPGRELCGTLHVCHIGIPMRLVAARAGRLWENGPELFSAALAGPTADSHKYARGHVAVFSGGPTSSGAARLSAMAALKAGAGAVTLVSPPDALAVNAAHLNAVMLREADGRAIRAMLSDHRVSAFVVGPGYGVSASLRELALSLLTKPTVLDADALTAFASEPKSLFEAIRAEGATVVMTPHEGEFGRLFPDLASAGGSKVERARKAAARSGAVIVYKGSDTVVAAPDGRAVINTNAPADLATAGSGDVLAGISAAMLAHGAPAFEAACAAVWIHGRAGQIAGRGLTAETLVEVIPQAVPETV